jgi:hypothetical protein
VRCDAIGANLALPPPPIDFRLARDRARLPVTDRGGVINRRTGERRQLIAANQLQRDLNQVA